TRSTIVTGNIGVAIGCHGHRAGGFHRIVGREDGLVAVAIHLGEVAQGSTADAHITVIKTGDIFAEFKADQRIVIAIVQGSINNIDCKGRIERINRHRVRTRSAGVACHVAVAGRCHGHRVGGFHSIVGREDGRIAVAIHLGEVAQGSTADAHITGCEAIHSFAELKADQRIVIAIVQGSINNIDCKGRIFGINRHRVRTRSAGVACHVAVAGRCHGHRVGGFHSIVGREDGRIAVAIHLGEVAQGSTADAHITGCEAIHSFAELKGDQRIVIAVVQGSINDIDCKGRIFGINRHRVRTRSAGVACHVAVAGRCHGHRANGFHSIVGREDGRIAVAIHLGEVAQGSTADAHITGCEAIHSFAELKGDQRIVIAVVQGSINDIDCHCRWSCIVGNENILSIYRLDTVGAVDACGSDTKSRNTPRQERFDLYPLILAVAVSIGITRSKKTAAIMLLSR
ncbi:hypothetical protein MAE30S32_23160, partial [Microcystis aeruginosa 11-30S32]